MARASRPCVVRPAKAPRPHEPHWHRPPGPSPLDPPSPCTPQTAWRGAGEGGRTTTAQAGAGAGLSSDARPALLGIDLGTTAVKAGVFDAESGRMLGVARAEYSPASPRAGWMELAAGEYWRATVEAVREAHEAAGRPEVAAIGLSSQGQTFLPLDCDREPLRPAIVWLDTRAEAEARRLNEILDADELRARRGAAEINAVDSAPKILWLRENEPDVWAQTRHLVMLPDFIGERLTGEFRLDVSNAGSTAMVDRTASRDGGAGDWWPAALDAVGVPREMLSPLGGAGEPIGAFTDGAASELGLTAGATVALGCNDQIAGAVGAGNVEPGIASGTAGTAMAIVATTDATERPLEGVLHGAHAVPGLRYLLTYAKTSGVLLTWLRDLLASADYEELLMEAREAPVGCDGLVCLPHFSGTATPSFRSDVRGGFVGLTLAHGRPAVARAVVEAVCFCARDALELARRSGQPVEELRMLGGAAQSDWWMQTMADVTRTPLAVPACPDAAVLGAAIFGGVGAGLLSSIDEAARAFYRADRRYDPNRAVAADYDAAYAAYRDAMERVYPGALG
ncbi:MAG: FGGY family carbohydrate kinase [Armatimonadota bacterium]